MKNRRILSHENLSVNQIRTVDPFAKFDSDVVNNITKISHSVDQPDVIIDGLDVIDNDGVNTEFVSQELIDPVKFEAYGNCNISFEEGVQYIQIYKTDTDVREICEGYVEQIISNDIRFAVRRFYGSDVTKTFIVSFSVSDGTPSSLYVKIGKSVVNLSYLDGAYQNGKRHYSVLVNVNFKDLSNAIHFAIGAYINTNDPRDFSSHYAEAGLRFFTISDVSCKMIYSLKSEDTPYTCSEDWDNNNIRVVRSLKVTEGTAVKDNVVINNLRSVNIGNTAVVLNLNDPKSWIHSNPYTITDFCRDRKQYNIKTVLNSQPKLTVENAYLDGTGHLKVSIRNTSSGQLKTYDPNDFDCISSHQVNILTSKLVGDYYEYETVTGLVSNYFCNNSVLATYNGKIITKVDCVITQEAAAPSVTFKIHKSVFEKYGIPNKDSIVAYYSDAVVRVDKSSDHVLWGYVVCYYSYYKNPDPNKCYIGLVREDEISKTGFTEDYLVLAKVRFIDPYTIDIIQYLDNRNNYCKLQSRDINYITNFNMPEIWYCKNPVTVEDAINYCQALRFNVSRRYSYKHEKDAYVDTTARLSDDFGENSKVVVDIKGTPAPTIHHMHRKFAVSKNTLLITQKHRSCPIDDALKFHWTPMKDKWFSDDGVWAISNDFSILGEYDAVADVIKTQYMCFNKEGPFKFIDPTNGRSVIELDWILTKIVRNENPSKLSDFDIGSDDDMILSYYPSEKKSNDAAYIDVEHEVANSLHNHFSYLMLRGRLLSRKYLNKLLDMLPLVRDDGEYLIDGRVLISVDGHICSSVHEIQSDLKDKNALNTLNISGSDPHIRINSTTYWFSTDNLNTKGTSVLKNNPKLFQDDQLLVAKHTSDPNRIEIQSSNYAINDIRTGYLLKSIIDANKVIHIVSNDVRIYESMTNGHAVIGIVYPKDKVLSTDVYKFDDNKPLSDFRFLSVERSSSGKRVISVKYVIDGVLKNGHVITSYEDNDHIIHITSSKTQISNNLKDGALLTNISKDESVQVIDGKRYTINDLVDKEVIKSTYDRSKQKSSLISENIILDLGYPGNPSNPLFKITKVGYDGKIHLVNSSLTANDLLGECWYLPKNITIGNDNYVHITIDCKKKFKVAVSDILKAIQTHSKYNSIFNLDVDADNNNCLFNIMINIDSSDTNDDVDRIKSEDGTFECAANYYESQLLFINDVDLISIRQHIVTERERDHIISEDGKQCLVAENTKGKGFRSYIHLDYVSNDAVIGSDIHWVDEFNGYDTQIMEDVMDPDMVHITGEGEDIDLITKEEDDPELGSVPDDAEDVDDIVVEVDELGKPHLPDDADDTDIEESETDSRTDELCDEGAEDVNLPDTTEEVQEDVPFGSDEMREHPLLTAYRVVSGDERTAYEICYPKRTFDTDNVLLDFNSFLSFYPAIVAVERFADWFIYEHGYAHARGPFSSIYSQTKFLLTFKFIRSKSVSGTSDIIPGISFDSTPRKSIYASGKSFTFKD